MLSASAVASRRYNGPYAWIAPTNKRTPTPAAPRLTRRAAYPGSSIAYRTVAIPNSGDRLKNSHSQS